MPSKSSFSPKGALSSRNMESTTHPAAERETQPPQGQPARQSLEERLNRLIKPTGIQLNGPNPWDVQVHHADFYTRILSRGSLGLGESYMDGLWDCEQLDEMVCRAMAHRVHQRINRSWQLAWHALRARLFNLQSLKHAFEVGERHYDIGNDLYQVMLDSSLSYSCGYWKNATDLEQAQYNKLDLLCRKLNLQPGETLLDIGCGWGGLARHAARHYGAKVTGITISKQQLALARQQCEGLDVDFVLQDYRLTEGRFDKMVSVGMFEHVGPKNYPAFMHKTHSLLRDDGIFVLHSIASQNSGGISDPWIDRYIFPNGKTPSLAEMAQACEQYFVIEDVHNFGPDYDLTLMAWCENFQRAWPHLADKYGERFYRMWSFYLKSSAGAFRSGDQQLLQLVLRKVRPYRNAYDAPR